MPSSPDPGAFTIDERTHELARLLAAGPVPATPSAWKKVSNNTQNELGSVEGPGLLGQMQTLTNSGDSAIDRNQVRRSCLKRVRCLVGERGRHRT